MQLATLKGKILVCNGTSTSFLREPVWLSIVESFPCYCYICCHIKRRVKIFICRQFEFRIKYCALSSSGQVSRLLYHLVISRNVKEPSVAGSADKIVIIDSRTLIRNVYRKLTCRLYESENCVNDRPEVLSAGKSRRICPVTRVNYSGTIIQKR